jgi:hypothetical protein
MSIYLTDAKKCDDKLTKRDANFRKVALVITYIDLALCSLVMLGLIYSMFVITGSAISNYNRNPVDVSVY